MISLIICSRKSCISDELKHNIQLSIGVEFELIIIDNSTNMFSIFEAYNEGVRRSKGDILCFMHDDILYHTQNWGEKIQQHFKLNSIGIIGVVGSHYMPKCPASWWSSVSASGQILQGSRENNKYVLRNNIMLDYKQRDQDSIDVVVLDGVWFCIPKKIFDRIRFDDVYFSGFHCYDSDICYQILKLDLSVKVVFDILIEHKSLGSFNDEFFQQQKKCYIKWADFLPQIRGIEISQIDIDQIINSANNNFIEFITCNNQIKKIKKMLPYKIGSSILKFKRKIFK